MTPHHRLLAAPIFCLLACQGGGTSAPGPGDRGTLPGAAVPLTRFSDDSFAYTFYSGITSRQAFVIRDQAAWSELWQNIHATTTPAPPLPEVDFSQEMVLAAALGTRSSGGYDVVLGDAAEDAAGLHVEVTESSPGAGCATTQALTQPVDLARMQRHDGPVQFVETRRVVPCDQ